MLRSTHVGFNSSWRKEEYSLHYSLIKKNQTFVYIIPDVCNDV